MCNGGALAMSLELRNASMDPAAGEMKIERSAGCSVITCATPASPPTGLSKLMDLEGLFPLMKDAASLMNGYFLAGMKRVVEG